MPGQTVGRTRCLQILLNVYKGSFIERQVFDFSERAEQSKVARNNWVEVLLSEGGFSTK